MTLVRCELLLIYGRGINYRQKVRDLLSEPELPSNIGQFSYQITVLCWLHRKQRADCLYVLSDFISLVFVKYKQLSNEFPSHRFDAGKSYGEASFIWSYGKIGIWGDPDPLNRIHVGNRR